MTTPTKEEIQKEAIALYHHINPHIEQDPEIDELKESGFWHEAQVGLMKAHRDESAYQRKQHKEVLRQLRKAEAQHGKLAFPSATEKSSLSLPAAPQLPHEVVKAAVASARKVSRVEASGCIRHGKTLHFECSHLSAS